MSLSFICIELRENLRCANVFLKFDQNLSETEVLKINIKDGLLQIMEGDVCRSFKLRDYFHMDARTLTNLTVEPNNASFRLSIGDIFMRENVHKRRQVPNKLDFIIGQQSTVHCSNCKSELFDLTCVIRTREFPTGAIDSAEFFCHAAADFTNILVPRICDIYYGFQFIVINTEHLDTSVRLKTKHIYCQRCLQYLGETMYCNKAAKLWTDSLQLKHQEDKEFCDLMPRVNTAILMQKIIDDCNEYDEPVHSMSFARIIIEATFPSRKRKYLMIQILEKELKVLRNEMPLLRDSKNNKTIHHKELVEYRSFKLLYRFVEEGDEDAVFRSLPALLQYWQQDISIQTLCVPYKLFGTLLEDLEQNSLLIPQFYRYSKDDFKLSYVFYQN